jgi:hypothetical protein
LELKLGDKVLLNTKNIKLKMPKDGTKKLLPKWIGPFEVSKIINDVAYKITLPENMKLIHNVFHVSLLKLYRDDGREPPPPPTVITEGVPFYEVERILDHRFVKRGRGMSRQYLVRWAGYKQEHDTWEPEANIAAGEGDILPKYWEYIVFEPPSK